MAVADQFDALSSERPYRSGLGLQGTLDFVSQQAGRGLDAKIVAAFIALVDAGDLPIQVKEPETVETVEAGP